MSKSASVDAKVQRGSQRVVLDVVVQCWTRGVGRVEQGELGELSAFKEWHRRSRGSGGGQEDSGELRSHVADVGVRWTYGGH